MNAANRALFLVVASMVLVAVGGAAFFVLIADSLPQTLPIPAGSAFTANDMDHWAAHFHVGSGGGRLVGAWTAYHGSGSLHLIVVNGTSSKPPMGAVCPMIVSGWPEVNGTVDEALTAGAYTTYWSTGFCSTATTLWVTQTIQVVSP